MMIERPVRSLKQKILQAPAKAGMKAFDESAEKQFQRAGLILLFVGEVARAGGTRRA
jgi:hypothetical protein